MTDGRADSNLLMLHAKALIATLAATGIASATHAAEQDFQTWNTINFERAVNPKIVTTLEIGGRLVDDAGRLGVAIVRPTIGYKVSDDVTFSLGYAHFRTVNRGRPDVSENRIFQQLMWRVGKVGTATAISRFRLEQRTVVGARDLGWRMTARMRLTIPTGRNRASVILSHEQIYALNTTDWGAHAGFDQMRNFAGVSVPLDTSVTFETGYQNRYLKRSGIADRIDHLVPITLNIRI